VSWMDQRHRLVGSVSVQGVRSRKATPWQGGESPARARGRTAAAHRPLLRG
jgi:hypothetical protein